MFHHLSCDTYKSYICNGFSELQQREEFVDMTLAADGHFVKVHRNLIALASPYIKDMLQSVPCPHPVLFLNNVSHEILNHILEYIYTGEVQIPKRQMNLFINAAKALHIKGIESIILQELNLLTDLKCESRLPDNFNRSELSSNGDHNLKIVNVNETTHEDISHNCVANNAQEYQISDLELLPSSTITKDNSQVQSNMNEEQILNSQLNTQNSFEIVPEYQLIPRIPTNESDYTNNVLIDEVNVETGSHDSLGIQNNTQINKNSETRPKIIITSQFIVKPPDAPSTQDAPSAQDAHSTQDKQTKQCDTSPLYTISNRGSLQLILNRYMYYLHHVSYKKSTRRWRCRDYRFKHCKAYVDTCGEVIVSRKHVHTHPFHDDKIIRKGKKQNVFTSITETLDYTNKHVFSTDQDEDIETE